MSYVALIAFISVAVCVVIVNDFNVRSVTGALAVSTIAVFMLLCACAGALKGQCHEKSFQTGTVGA